MREKVNFSVEEVGEFEIYVEPTFLEEKKIEALMGELYGGNIPLQEVKVGMGRLARRIAPDTLQDKDILENAYSIAVLINCQENYRVARMYSMIKILGIKVPDNFGDLNPKDVDKIVSAHEVALDAFFRSLEERKSV